VVTIPFTISTEEDTQAAAASAIVAEVLAEP